MEIVLRIRITALVILHALFPRPGKPLFAAQPGSPATGLLLCIGRMEIPACLGNLEQTLTPQGDMTLLFPHCLALAAPFLLFRLKRTGFSNCRITMTKGGLELHAAR